MKRVPAIKKTAPAPASRENASAQRPGGLVLDCDGVLFDSRKANTAYYNHIRHAVRLPPMTEDEAAYAHMASTEEALERMIPDELKEEAMRARSMTRYRETFMSMMQPAPYMVSFLKNMRKAGMRLALCTNRSDSVYDVLRHFGVEEYFSPVVTITRVQPKPSPQGLLEVAKTWGADARSIIFLGDSLVDQQAAEAANVPFWSYGNPGLTAAMHISGFRELNGIMHRMLR